MTKRSQKEISKNDCTVYCVNSNKYYIKGDKIEGQINLRKLNTNMFAVNNGEVMTEQQIINLTK